MRLSAEASGRVCRKMASHCRRASGCDPAWVDGGRWVERGELEDALVGERKHGGSGELGGGGGAQHTARAVSAAGGADRGFSAPSPRTLPRGSSHASASALPPLPEMPAELSAELPRDDGGGDDEAGGGGL